MTYTAAFVPAYFRRLSTTGDVGAGRASGLAAALTGWGADAASPLGWGVSTAGAGLGSGGRAPASLTSLASSATRLRTSSASISADRACSREDALSRAA